MWLRFATPRASQDEVLGRIGWYITCSSNGNKEVPAEEHGRACAWHDIHPDFIFVEARN